MFKFFKKKNSNETQDVVLGGGIYFLECSSDYIISENEEGVIEIYPDGNECVTLRLNVFTYHSKDNNDEITTGSQFVLEEALKNNEELIYIGDKVVSFSSERLIENNTPLTMNYWKIGLNSNNLVVMSATILESKQKDKRVRKMLDSIETIIASIEKTEKEVNIKTSKGEINYTVSNATSATEEGVSLKPNNVDFINEWIEKGKHIIKYYEGSKLESQLDFDKLDKTFKTWQKDTEEKFDTESIKLGLGAIFGDLLNKELNMQWILINDEYDEELAVRHANDFTSFPFSSIQKRIESGESDFFNNIYQMIKHNLEN